MRLKDRWYVAGEVRSEDYFAVKVPWWLRIKRFVHDGRTKDRKHHQALSEWLKEEAERDDK